MCGWIKVHREMKDHWCSADPNFMAVWMHLLMAANFKDKKSLVNKTPVLVKRGQLVFGRNAWAKRTGVSVNKLRRIISILEGEQMIHQQNFSKYTIITITKWDEYQVDHQQTTSKPPANHQQTTTLEEGKERKEGEKDTRWVARDTIPDDFLDYAQKIGLSNPTGCFLDFQDYWLAAPGKQGLKRNWLSTWQRWARKQIEYQKEKQPTKVVDFRNPYDR